MTSTGLSQRPEASSALSEGEGTCVMDVLVKPVETSSQGERWFHHLTGTGLNASSSVYNPARVGALIYRGP